MANVGLAITGLSFLRYTVATVVNPGNWTLQGCYSDNPGTRTLGGSTFTNTTGMTWEACTSFCDEAPYVFAGVEFGQECYCGNATLNGGANTTFTDCNMPCTGNSSEICGGPGRLDFFWNGMNPPPPPISPEDVGLWHSLGCYNDSTAARTLTVPVNVAAADGVSVESCTDTCLAAGYSLAGMEFADECYCDTKFNNFGAFADDGGCTDVCVGNASEFCGGANRLNVYNYTGVITIQPTPPNGGGGNNGGGPAPVPVTQGLPSPWNYSGCWVDNVNGRILLQELPDNANLTVPSCIESCQAGNFSLAGIEFGVQCFCGDEIVNGGVLATDQTSCNMDCPGNTTQACGAGNRISLYSTSTNVTALPVPVPQNTSLPGNWMYQGCLAEPGANRVFPYQLIYPTNNSAQTCLTQCATYGYGAAGMEFGDECWCGDAEDIQANGGEMAPESDCSMPCSGDLVHLCGGSQRLQLYLWSGTPLNVWHNTTNPGQYEYLIGGLIIPLIATLGVNNKVTFLEKFGTGPPNTTGAYELDLSLVPQPNSWQVAWREMHVKTDVFCSGTVVLPDKGGRQLNVGGWSLDSTFGVRLYTPDGSPGVNGTNDWEENVQELSLQNGRWYPGAMVMANGSVLVVGGEAGSNGAPVPTLETLPTPSGGATTLFMQWLQDTDPNNLYPFLMVLPHGGVFVIYYNQARILDENTFETVRTFPTIPGSVTGGGGRTYPLEGTAVIMPQHYPYTDPIEVLTCGGSNFGNALDNCVTIAPETPNATWVIERMPMKRVMPCMVALPDGTYMILNGAGQGVAGFGLASQPVLTALLYDPTLPVGQRITILESTIVARLYHSEAILLQDGRVLVSGSDPEDNINPQEYRVEVYIPPYLSTPGIRQPSFNITNTDWEYGAEYGLTNIKLYQGDSIRVSLLGAVGSTHGNSMGQRTIFPAFNCAGASCTVTAPINAHICPPGWYQLFILDGPTPSWSQWVRIGGDPAQLGNWPDFPDFTRPGI